MPLALSNKGAPTYTVIVLVPLQPMELVTVTVYVVVLAGETVGALLVEKPGVPGASHE